jgi:predicted Zn-dependent protease
MRRLCCNFLAALFLITPFLPITLHAQRNRDPLTDQESDEVANLRDRPNDRVKLFQKFLQQRIDSIKAIGPHPATDDRKADLRAKYEEFTHITDELQDNLDTFDQAHADIRKSLKDLVPATQKWVDLLNEQTPGGQFDDFSRKTALEAAQSANDEAEKLYKSQKEYFEQHKDERGKNGTGPS